MNYVFSTLLILSWLCVYKIGYYFGRVNGLEYKQKDTALELLQGAADSLQEFKESGYNNSLAMKIYAFLSELEKEKGEN